MQINVKFFATFIQLFGGREKEIELDSGANIQDLLNLLCDRPKCREKIFDNSGRVRTHIQILKNHRPIQSLEGVYTQLVDGDSVGLLPPMFGG